MSSLTRRGVKIIQVTKDSDAGLKGVISWKKVI
jgi:hypothetical protein